MADIKRSVATFLRKCFALHSDLRDFDDELMGLDDYNVAILEGCFEILDDGLEDASWKLRGAVNWQNSNWNAYPGNRNWNAERNVTLASLISDSTAALALGYELLDVLDAQGNKAGADALEELMDLFENVPDIFKALPQRPRQHPFKSTDVMATAMLDVIARELLENDNAFELELVDVSRSRALKIRGSKSFTVSYDAYAQSFDTKQDLVHHLRSNPMYKVFLKAYAERILDIGKQLGNVSLSYKTPGEPAIDPNDAFEYIRGTFTHYYDPKQKSLRRSIMATRRKDDLVNERTLNLFEKIRRIVGLVHPDDVLYE